MNPQQPVVVQVPIQLNQGTTQILYPSNVAPVTLGRIQLKLNFVPLYPKIHFPFGVTNLVIGSLIMCLDPLLTIIYSAGPTCAFGALFMIIGGMASIHGSWNKSRQCFVAAVVMYGSALVGLFGGIIFWPMFLDRFRFLLYNIVIGVIAFILVLVHLVYASKEVCCRKRKIYLRS